MGPCAKTTPVIANDPMRNQITVVPSSEGSLYAGRRSKGRTGLNSRIPVIRWERCRYRLHFADHATEAWRRQVTCPTSQSWTRQTRELNRSSLTPEAIYLTTLLLKVVAYEITEVGAWGLSSKRDNS